MTVVIATVSLMVGQAGIHPYEIVKILLSKLFP